ncbi:hypothetical protein CCUS01_00472 [Colletotrichum cuscutae]|uniref:Uncharacterized protein n=3 Tax=Colletotrichum acutatum species complex TaxID=2707335 RepID=A0AAI9Z1H2_9PEZI|nr:uncharacterized protein CCOS01_05476 [Colletotrichum costaricense]XP_060388668.1 uncharacterized protein CTAM01_01164 [Colletotrichum tamarilloi]KAK1479918.1 hypothetical protein CCUS01_00472 [Colletotrichum cuscutae]KAK1512234.1 hypothetical protein CTAM01_01164 [Colletotrichum tamarilloi]KAK1530373.1 hypothetical protein CCOS01_05476 [Colletotrichum costaricense]
MQTRNAQGRRERERSPDERMGESRGCWFGSNLDFR